MERPSISLLGLVSVPATLLLAFLTPVVATAYDAAPERMRNLDRVHSVADRVWQDYGGSLTAYEFWGRFTVLAYLGAVAGLWAFHRLSAPSVGGQRVLMIALASAAVADFGAYWAPDDSIVMHIAGMFEFLLLLVVWGAVIWYGWALRRSTLRSRWPGWVLIGGAALVPVSMTVTNYWPHGLLLPILSGISVLAVAAAAGLSVVRES